MALSPHEQECVERAARRAVQAAPPLSDDRRAILRRLVEPAYRAVVDTGERPVAKESILSGKPPRRGARQAV